MAERGAVYEGGRSKVVTLDDILATKALWGSPSSRRGTGDDTQTAVRNIIVAAHREWGMDCVLIGGDDDVVPVRMVAAPIFDTEYRELPADIQYSGLDGDWGADGEGCTGNCSAPSQPCGMRRTSLSRCSWAGQRCRPQRAPGTS